MDSTWTAVTLVTILIGITGFVLRLIIVYVKKELEQYSIAINEHSIEMAKNTEQLRSLFKFLSKLNTNNENFEKRITKLEIKQQAVEERCKIYHKD